MFTKTRLILEQIELIKWLLSRDYSNLIRKMIKQSVGKDLPGLLAFGKSYFPFLNNGYFKGFETLKKDCEELVPLNVRELPLPDDLLGAYLPETSENPGTVFINTHFHPVFRLSTLAHEVCHAAVYQFYQQKGTEPRSVRLRNRVVQFKEDLKDKEEVLSDILISLGTYPLPDFKKIFYQPRKSKSDSVTLKDFLTALRHLKNKYPEVAQGFWGSRHMFLNIALIIHFLRLRMIVYRECTL